MNLEEMSINFDTDKNINGHNYVKIYDKYFRSIKDRVKSILEIGVWKGESLKMWSEYFKHAKIYGIDISENSKEFLDKNKNENIIVKIGSQSDLEFLKNEISDKKYDVIIDDGSHLANDQIITFNYLLGLVNPGGYYIIEDVHTAYWPGWGGDGLIEYTKSLIDELNFNGLGYSYANKCGDRDFMLKTIKSSTEFQNLVESIHFHNSLIIFKMKDK